MVKKNKITGDRRITKDLYDKVTTEQAELVLMFLE